LIGLVYAETGHAQIANLLPNGSFDKVLIHSANKSTSRGDFGKMLSDWYTFGGLYEGTPDFINPRSSWHKSLQKLSISTKNNFAGISCVAHPASEIISSRLATDLQPGCLYKISLRVNAPLFHPLTAKKQLPRNLADHFGFVFSMDKAPDILSLHKTKPDVVFHSWVVPGNWSTVVASFTPDSSFRYVHIGCFFPKDESTSPYYYLVDDIAVTKAAELDTMPAETKPQLESIRHTLDSGTVFFDVNSCILTDSAKCILDILSNYLMINPVDFAIQLSGYADTTGDRSFNWSLSEKRTEAVSRYLIQSGMESDKIQKKWFGSHSPNASGKETSSMREDRRVSWIVKNNVESAGTEPSVVYSFSNEIEGKQDEDIKRSLIGVQANSPKPRPTSEYLPLLHSSRPVSAINYILAKAKQTRVLMLNEQHHQPMHRAFATQLLKGLFAQGYRVLAIEMLTEAGDDLMARGYPVLQSGYYFPEPYLGDFVRMAINNGFKVLGYEAGSDEIERVTDSLFQVEKRSGQSKLDPNDPLHAMNARDYIQAINLKKIITENPGSKVFVYCGSGHIRERKYANWRTLALNLKMITGIDPLTVDQAQFSNASWLGISFATNAGSVPVPTVFLDSISTKPFVAREYDLLAKVHTPDCYDIQVFHPDSSWQLVNGHRKVNNLDTLIQPVAKECPCLLYLWHAYEDEGNAVPVVVNEVGYQDKNVRVFLPSGTFTLVLHDKSRKVLRRQIFKSN